MSLTAEEHGELVAILDPWVIAPTLALNDLAPSIDRIKYRAWCEGRDAAAVECEDQAGAMESPYEIADLIRALKSPYESQP